jgi:hypothetical protein
MAAVFASRKSEPLNVGPSGAARKVRPVVIAGRWRDWLVVLGPAVLVALGCLTAFRDFLVGSIGSLSQAGLWLVYAIFLTYFAGVVLVAMAIRTYTREADLIARWRSSVPVGRTASMTDSLSGSGVRPVYEALLEEGTDPGDRQARLEREFAEFRERLGQKLMLPHFMTGALVGLGLLGTFVGLIGTLGEFGEIFRVLSAGAKGGGGGAAPLDVFSDMLARMQKPMASMATAFITSFFGLGGSLVLGLSTLMAGKVGGRIGDELREAALMHELAVPRPGKSVITKPSDHEWLQLELRLRSEQWQSVLADMRDLHQGHERESAALREGIAEVARSTQGLVQLLQHRMRVEQLRGEAGGRRTVGPKSFAQRREKELKTHLDGTREALRVWEAAEEDRMNGQDSPSSAAVSGSTEAEDVADLRDVVGILRNVEHLLAQSLNRPLSVTLTVDPTRDEVAPCPRSPVDLRVPD